MADRKRKIGPLASLTSGLALAALTGIQGCAIASGGGEVPVPETTGLARVDPGVAQGDAGRAASEQVEWTRVVQEDAGTLLAKVQDGFLHVRIESSLQFSSYDLFIDSVGGPSGLDLHDWPTRSGGDYLIENGSLYKTVGPAWGTEPIADGVAPVPGTPGTAFFEGRISLETLQIEHWERPIGLALLATVDGTKVTLPSTAQFAQLDPRGRPWNARRCTFETSAAPAAAAAPKAEPQVCPDPGRGERKFAFQGPAPRFAFGQGVIIPAYIAPTVPPKRAGDEDDRPLTPWQQLESGAKRFRERAEESAQTDYIVVATGPNMGPPPLPTSDAIRTAYDAVSNAKGRIFGYVHTCVDCLLEGPERTGKFINLSDMQQQITQWVCLYPDLDGIWLDEFYPRDELGDPDAYGVHFRNGEENAPADRCFINPDNSTHPSVQVDPAGGYFHRLTEWIRRTYPQLLIIGNAGGRLESNQHRYHELVDLLVTVERAYDKPATGVWQNVVPRNAGLGPKQLALFHTANELQMTTAITDARSAGYTHVYVTDRPLHPNVWGEALPAYFEEEIELITSRR